MVDASRLGEVIDILVSSRSLDDYRTMFSLTDADLCSGRILDCGGGAASLVADVRARGGQAVAIDPLYHTPLETILAQAVTSRTLMADYMSYVPRQYHVGAAGEIEAYLRGWDAARSRFAADARTCPADYVGASLPHLPFPDKVFSLALCAYLLFTFPEHFPPPTQVAALRELARVTRGEVRIYPIVDGTGCCCRHLELLRSTLASDNPPITSQLRAVPHHWQANAHEMLVLNPSG